MENNNPSFNVSAGLFPDSKVVEKEAREESFAEVVESSVGSFVAQCWQWDVSPEFGSLVCSKNGELIIVGCVDSIQTKSIDPLRTPFAFQKNEEDLRAEQPQIFDFLKTSFEVKVLGYFENENLVRYRFPSKPAKIHSFIQNCATSQEHLFFAKPDFLYPLFSSSVHIENFDELLLAVLSRFIEKNNSQGAFEQVSSVLSMLTRNNYSKMKILIGRLQSICGFE
jgi:hypothetical protein